MLLEYCNLILLGIVRFSLCQLQSIVNCAAQVIGNKIKYSLISQYVLETLHWLPVGKQISCYSSCLHMPHYVRELCVLGWSQVDGYCALLGVELCRSHSSALYFKACSAVSSIGSFFWNSLSLCIYLPLQQTFQTVLKCTCLNQSFSTVVQRYLKCTLLSVIMRTYINTRVQKNMKNQ